jgi:uncharacterized protein (UPF0218 family)
MTDDNISELREAVAELRERVSELERRLDSPDAETAESGVYDRYDRAVLEAVGDVTAAHPREVMSAYEEVGVYDGKKQKRRTKRLKRLEKEE